MWWLANKTIFGSSKQKIVNKQTVEKHSQFSFNWLALKRWYFLVQQTGKRRWSIICIWYAIEPRICVALSVYTVYKITCFIPAIMLQRCLYFVSLFSSSSSVGSISFRCTMDVHYLFVYRSIWFNDRDFGSFRNLKALMNCVNIEFNKFNCLIAIERTANTPNAESRCRKQFN